MKKTTQYQRTGSRVVCVHLIDTACTAQHTLEHKMTDINPMVSPKRLNKIPGEIKQAGLVSLLEWTGLERTDLPHRRPKAPACFLPLGSAHTVSITPQTTWAAQHDAPQRHEEK